MSAQHSSSSSGLNGSVAELEADQLNALPIAVLPARAPVAAPAVAALDEGELEEGQLPPQMSQQDDSEDSARALEDDDADERELAILLAEGDAGQTQAPVLLHAVFPEPLHASSIVHQDASAAGSLVSEVAHMQEPQ